MHGLIKQAAAAAALTVVATVGVASPAMATNYGSYKNYYSDACLDSNSSGSVYTLGCNTGNYQDWDIQNISGDLYYLRNRATDRCLDANSSDKVYTLSCNGGLNQRWLRLVTTSGGGLWKNHKTGACLKAESYDTTKGAVITEDCDTGIRRQKWRKVAA